MDNELEWNFLQRKHTYGENNIFGKVNFLPQFSQRSVLKAEKT